MAEDFARDALLIFERMFRRKLWAVLDEGFLGVGGFAVNQADEADQLIPGLAMRVPIFPSVNRGELPLFLP